MLLHQSQGKARTLKKKFESLGEHTNAIQCYISRLYEWNVSVEFFDMFLTMFENFDLIAR